MGNTESKIILVAAAAAVAAWSQEAQHAEAQFTQAGGYWVRTITGAADAYPVLRVSARANIVLRGGSGDKVVYKLVQRVRAAGQKQADRLIGEAVGVADTSGGMTRLTVTPLGSRVSSKLELFVPRRTAIAYLESQGGDIEAYDYHGSVDAGTMYGQIHFDRIGGNVSGRTGGGDVYFGKIGGTVRCASGGGQVYVENAGGATNCATAGGDMDVEEVLGPLQLSTEGNIRVRKARSTVEAHSAAGIIEVGSAGGAVTADTRGGSIQVGSAHGVRAESAQGAVRVKSGSGPMSVSTAAGSILAELLAGARLENSTLAAAGLGDITVFIPSNVAVTIMARNDSNGTARIVTDFPEIRVQPALLQSPVLAQGAINGGGPVLFISAASGAIYLRKR
jgi:hypothetical protein